MRPTSRVLACLALAAASAAPASAQRADPAGPFSALRFRSIGPAVTGGRIDDVEALRDDPSTIYVATATGGIWKTTNRGTTWTPIFDGQSTSVFGDLAIAPSDPAVLWAGTGEQNNRQSSSWGDGVYRSTDAGRSWTHLGLEHTRAIGRIVVDPRNPDVAWVAAQGNLWAPGPDRGVYRTRNGGATWQRVLFVDSLTGATDLAMDPANPEILYAATYQRLRRTWGYNGGGPGSGIYRSGDGGATWRRLGGGLPGGTVGRIGLAVAPGRPGRVYARVEHATRGGVYRSDDGGESWTRVSDLNPRPSYYGALVVDPKDADRVYLLSEDAYVSERAGAEFRLLPFRPTYDVGVHSDFHALWIDPGNPEHLYLAGDGGLHQSWDRGRTYEKIDNLPIAQIYGIGADLEDPYNVYLGLQDNHSWMGPSATRHWIGILNDDWRQIGFGDGMYASVDLLGRRFVYSNAQNGSYTRVDAETGDVLDIAPRAPAGEPPYRFDWDSPSLASRHTPGLVYVGGNRLFASRDRGETWTRSGDLTRRIDRDSLSLMGVRGSAPMLSKNDGESSYGEITTLAESPVDGRVLWVGTDDGLVQVSRDGGATWTEVGRNLPRRGTRLEPTTYVSRVTASAATAGRAYVALDPHRDGEFFPAVFRTDDFGRTWRSIAAGLPRDGTVNDVIEHPGNPRVLLLGTERGLFVSVDGGARWAPLGANLPTTIYEDLMVHPRDGDLIVATHGRSVWILDDAAPLAEWSPRAAAEPVHLFSIRPARIFQYWKDTSYRGQAAYAGENPPEGALISYHLRRPGTAVLTVADAAGRVVHRDTVPGEAGPILRVSWDLRHDLPSAPRAVDTGGALPVPPHALERRGPFVSPGVYTVTLASGDARATRTVEVRGDPAMPSLTPADYRAREAFLLDLLDLERRADALGGAGADLRRGIGSLYESLNGGGVAQGSLHPPTPAMRARRDGLERALGEAEGTARGPGG